jgi:hypothetical protein
LQPFDVDVAEIVRPAYYGRYVDDMLLVIASDKQAKRPVRDFVKRTMVKPGILRMANRAYEIANPGNLFLQHDKCILQHFDVEHSIAGLEKFKKQLDENASNFMLLPVEETDSSLGEVAYDLLYDGSVNRFRSVRGLAENRFELAKHISRQTKVHLFTTDSADRKILVEVLHFFRGRNAIEFHDLWERILSLFEVAQVPEGDKFAEQIRGEIKKIRAFNDEEIGQKLKKDLLEQLRISQEMALALKASIPKNARFILNEFPVEKLAIWRQSNLIRHNLVRIPLLNFTSYSGSLLRHPTKILEIDGKKIDFSPRYVHFDECMMLADSGLIELPGEPFDFAVELYARFNKHSVLEDVNIKRMAKKGKS